MLIEKGLNFFNKEVFLFILKTKIGVFSTKANLIYAINVVHYEIMSPPNRKPKK